MLETAVFPAPLNGHATLSAFVILKCTLHIPKNIINTVIYLYHDTQWEDQILLESHDYTVQQDGEYNSKYVWCGEKRRVGQCSPDLFTKQ